LTQQITKSILVKGDLKKIYGLWANFENFPRFMKSVKAVSKTGDTTSHWVVEGPAGMNVDWNAEMTRRDPNKRIAWNSKDKKGMLTTSGQVTFNSLPDKAVEVTVTMQITPPAGKVGEAISALLVNPERRLVEDLRNFKNYVEQNSR
jgi:uncharacterized membrane protein